MGTQVPASLLRARSCLPPTFLLPLQRRSLFGFTSNKQQQQKTVEQPHASTSSPKPGPSRSSFQYNEDARATAGEEEPSPAPDGLPDILPSFSQDGPVLAQDNLFHVLSRSPFQDLRDKADRIKKRAYCPVHLRDGVLKHVDFECPYSGFPTHYSQKEWEEDDQHDRYWPRLREWNEDEHDIRSGRRFWELELPEVVEAEEPAIMANNWEHFCFTTGFQDMSDRQLRHLTRQMTYPMTVASTLAPMAPQFNYRNDRLTPEGRRSMLAIHETTFRTRGTTMSLKQKPFAPLRIIIVGARVESAVDGYWWHFIAKLFQTKYYYPCFHIYLVGPEVVFTKTMTADAEKYGVDAASRTMDRQMQITAIKCRYEDIHDALGPFDPYYDIFFAFQPGFGFPDPEIPGKVQLETNWNEAVRNILDTKCTLVCTGLSPADMERDVLALDRVDGIAGSFDWIITPGENVFRSRRWEIAEFDPRIFALSNWGTWAIRGKTDDAFRRLMSGDDRPLLSS